MPPPPLYSAFKDVIRNTFTIRDASSNYKVHSRIIENLLAEFESHQQSRTSKEKKPLVESISQIRITRWAKNILSMKHGNQLYTYWEPITACGVRMLLNESYEDTKAEYGIPRSTMTGNLRKICHPLQCRNTRHL